MSPHRIGQRIFAILMILTVALTLNCPAQAGSPPIRHDHVGVPGPINAQTTFGWGKPLWQDDFVGPRKNIWEVKGPGVVQNQVGMLTLNTAKRKSVSATLRDHAYRTGRWEIRLRSRRYAAAYEDYRVVTELIPAGQRKQFCGAKNVSLETYRLGSNTSRFYLRNRPNIEFTAKRRLNLGADQWHTFAVEITKTRISWIVDSHVVMSERRPEALSGSLFTVRFKMKAVPGQRMNPSRMQMDWLRYFTLQRPNTKPMAGPKATLGSYSKAC
jgi:hypothetical protein